MTRLQAPPALQDGRVLARPPSIFTTALTLPEVRWALGALVLFFLGWGLQLGGAPELLWWAAYLACYGVGGWQQALSGLNALREKTLDVDLLMVVAAIAAASIGQVFDGALLIVIFATSGALEVIVTRRTADSVDSLLGLAPEQAELLHEDGSTSTVAGRDLEPGHRIIVRPGERIGGDGTVVEGVSEVDQQAITGESVPVTRGMGDEVLSGTVNGTGTLTVEITRPASESVISRIVTLVEEASGTKAKTQLFIEKVEQRYSLGVVVGTLLVLTVPMLFFAHTFEDALLRAIVFMIVASPCAVVLSTMPPLLASIANAGRHGVLVKSATVMETIGRSSVVAFDKTGTLTEGSPEVSAVEPGAGHGADQVLALAAAVERHSEHPLGRAVVQTATQRGLTLPEVDGFRALPGRGVTGSVSGRTVTVERAERGTSTTGTRVQVRCGDEVIGTILLVDRLRVDAPDAVRAVSRLTGSPAVLLTGDNASTAAAVAQRTGIGTVHHSLMPQDKVGIVDELSARGEHVLVVGDGINDAPALATAGTGVAMGRRGSDLALDTSDVIIVRDELGALENLVRLSRKARRYVIANLTIAATFIVTLVTLDLVATLPLGLAVAGHEGSTVLVALNGARLLRRSAWEG
ncbi:cadmium-translocating P-type ATPase [Nocardiopsis sp. HNM0947]|uniref:Cadmium-translocating P-type ATPase n=1 Tax=Nocardiopsis coralli TaxID=2772213 RepID=A0ABR9P3N0_9ACTN|nr:heavy metal translocating P-type ATPase [Nocardiopsis coralli]MBE2998442.1 cadmium-translocating P-type ATPase [Nocardiopsis coralli]